MKRMPAILFRLWHDDRLTRLIMPILSIAYTVVYTSVPVPQPPWMSNIPHTGWITIIGLMGLCCSIVLYWSRTHPFAVITIEAVLYITLSVITMDESFLIPLLAALYSCVALPPVRQAVAGVVDATAAVSVVTVLLHRHDMLFIEWVARMTAVTTISAIALASRTYHVWHEAQLREQREQEKAERLIRQRDQAAARAGIAAELHDSVGHDLTTIIALSEGFARSHNVTEIHEVLEEINQVARDGLQDTRQAVHALSHDDQTHDNPDSEQGPSLDNHPQGYGATVHHWDEIGSVLDHARATGLAVVHTETGRRPDDPAQANLCFIISREAITNTLRHASNPSMIIVSWDHHDDGSIHVSIHDDGKATAQTLRKDDSTTRTDHSGNGLLQIAKRCAAADGTLHYGTDETSGWSVNAAIPATTPVTRHNDDQAAHTGSHTPSSQGKQS